jgi:glycerol-3-phosphate dehydrogenase (NAD(P)+)
VRSAQAVVRARAAGIEMPIAEAVCAVLDGKLSAPRALNRLLARDPKPEADA